LCQPSGLGGQFDGAEWGLSFAYSTSAPPSWLFATFLVRSGEFRAKARRKPREGIKMTTLIKMLKDESGASAAEYALILAIVGTGIAIAALLLGGAIGNSMNKATNCITTPGTTNCGAGGA
jgi:pilus assembly protein Flp/PilA